MKLTDTMKANMLIKSCKELHGLYFKDKIDELGSALEDMMKMFDEWEALGKAKK